MLGMRQARLSRYESLRQAAAAPWGTLDPMRALTLQIVTWSTVGGVVIAALSLGTLDHSRNGWLGNKRMAASLTLPTEPEQAGVVAFVHATAAATPASSAHREARLPLR